MGIHDRDYYRAGPGFLSRLAEQGKVTLWLVGLNVACFLLQSITTPQGSRGSPVTEWMLLDFDALMAGQVWRLFSYAFAHGGIWHLVGNMLFLWWFGRQVEDEIGSREFLIFYLLAALLAGLVYLGVELLYSKTVHPMLGASGAVMAVLVVAACYNPRQVIYLFFVIPVPIWLFVVGFALHDLLGLVRSDNNGVATAAHLGGAAFGFLYYRLSWRLAGIFRWVRLPSRSRPRLKLYREEDDEPRRPAPRPVAAGARLDDEHLEAQVDDILAKVSRVGMEGLSDHERQVLVRASEAIKRRRG